jgi:hypothetical protein
VLSTDFAPPRQSSRLAGAVGALLLQVAFLWMFLNSLPKITQPIETARELTFLLHRPAPPPVVLTPLRTVPPTAAHARPVIEPPTQVIAPPAATLPDLRDFGQALIDCVPERLANLPAEQKARCPQSGASLTPPEDMAPHSIVKDEPHWETEFAHEQSPLWLPCTTVIGDSNVLNLYCLGVMAAKGTLADRDNWPVYNGAGKN